MTERDPLILLTNDDGIDAPGLVALHEALTDVGTVRVVAPAGEQSAMGRSLSYGRSNLFGSESLGISLEDDEYSFEVAVEEHDRGYALRGTPCDCVIAGVRGFDRTPDLVVSGCNPGPNLGEGIFARSGTVSAAMEAAYLGVPAIAVSSNARDIEDGYRAATEFTVELAERSLEDSLAPADFLNVNVPARGYSSVSVTRPCTEYRMTASFDGNAFRLANPMLGEDPSISIDPEEQTDRAAFIARREVSVTPLERPHTPVTAEIPLLEELDAGV